MEKLLRRELVDGQLFIGGKGKNKKIKMFKPEILFCFILFSEQIGVCIKTWGQDLWAESTALC